MFTQKSKNALMGPAPKKRRAGNPSASPERLASDRLCLGASDTVTELDRRRPSGSNPNSRRSRNGRGPGVSSHLQEGVLSMDGTNLSYDTFVGIDVSKATIDVAFWPESPPLTLGNDAAGFTELRKRLESL